MLGKMLKHEWKATWRYLTLLNAATLLFALIGWVGNMKQLKVHEYLVLLYITVYALFLLASAVVTVVLLVMRFYRNLFTDEGYLTNTLPVSACCKLNTKILNSFFWICINALCIIVSISLVLSRGFDTKEFQEFCIEWIELLKLTTGMSTLPSAVAILVVQSIFGCLNTILMLFFSISVGCCFRTRKILASVITFFLTYVALQAVSSIFMMLSGYFTIFPKLMQAPSAKLPPELSPIYGMLLIIGILLNIVTSIIYYLACRHILSKKLNLS